MKTPLIMLSLCMAIHVHAQRSDSSHHYYTKASAEKTAGRHLVASQLYLKAINHDPRNKEAIQELGYTFLAMKRIDLAKEQFTNLYTIDPSNTLAIQELMELHYNYRQYAQAIEFAEKCRCDKSDRVLGLSYYKQEDYASAEKYLGKALEKNPSDAELAYTMGRNYLDMEEYTKAVPYYSKAVKLDESRNAWMYELGLLYYNLNDYRNALAAFEKAVAHGYQKTNDFNENMGYASLYSGEYDKGEQLLLDIWKRKPGNKEILRVMSNILYQQKQYDRSLSYCQKLMEIDMKDGKALYQAGLCFQKKGEKDRGQQMCDKAIQMDPSLESLRRKKEMPGGGL